MGYFFRYFYGFCPEPVAIECRRKSDQMKWTSIGKDLNCDVNDGFYCINNKQDTGLCDNFEVRFFCYCESKSS